jgi:hypothetical protein
VWFLNTSPFFSSEALPPRGHISCVALPEEKLPLGYNEKLLDSAQPGKNLRDQKNIIYSK